MSSSHPKRVAVITGDVTIDWNLAYLHHKEQTTQTPWSPDDQGTLSWQRGGAAMLAEVIREVLRQVDPEKFDVIGVDESVASPEKQNELSPSDRTYNHSFALWGRDAPDPRFVPSPVWRQEEKDEKYPERWVWRVKRYLGFKRHRDQVLRSIAPRKSVVQGKFEVEVVPWGSGGPATGNNQVFIGLDTSDRLHIRIFDTNGNRITDTDETKLPSTQAGAIASLKQRLRVLSPKPGLTGPDKNHVLTEVKSIVGQYPVNVIVLDDLGLGFRDKDQEGDRYWPEELFDKGLWKGGKDDPWVVLQTSRTLDKDGRRGKLLNHLLNVCPKRLIVVLTIDELRSAAPVRIPPAISWERTAEDLANGLMDTDLLKCRHLVVSLGTVGAALLSRSEIDLSPSKFELYYAPRFMEKEWELSSWGWMLGNTVTLTAALAHRVMIKPDEPDLEAGIRAGVAAIRELYLSGYICTCDQCLLGLNLTPWGSGGPATGNNQVFIGLDTSDRLHIRIFDTNGNRITDTDETKLPSTQAGAIASLKQRLRVLSPKPVLTGPEKDQVLTEVTSILYQTLPGYRYQFKANRDHAPALAFPTRQVAECLLDGLDLQLLSPLNDKSGIPAQGKDRIIVAAVNERLYFRIFDKVDTDETNLTGQDQQIKDLRTQLASLWPPHKLTRSEKDSIVRAVTSIVAYPPADGSRLDYKRRASIIAADDLSDISVGTASLLQDWTILNVIVSDGRQQPRSVRPWLSKAEGIVRTGIADQNIPMGRFGELSTVDRRELEALRSIRGLIYEYSRDSRLKSPLNLAVFGPPGAGKSFAVEQVAHTVIGSPGAAEGEDSLSSNIEIETITFNLSQFLDPAALPAALHRVHDLVLSGKLPLVFWDEFDTPLNSHELGWLRFFLSPMQEGTFLENQIVHPIGRCIFVFAGGTYNSKDEFEEQGERQDRRVTKALDFTSRLHGSLDISGINPEDDKPHFPPYYLIRRAVLLRSLIHQRAGHLFTELEIGKRKVPFIPGRTSRGTLHIDDGVLRAFLDTKRYKHGSRSMKAIVDLSKLKYKEKFDRSSLPSRTLLSLHVEADDFEEKLVEKKSHGS